MSETSVGIADELYRLAEKWSDELENRFRRDVFPFVEAVYDTVDSRNARQEYAYAKKIGKSSDELCALKHKIALAEECVNDTLIEGLGGDAHPNLIECKGALKSLCNEILEFAFSYFALDANEVDVDYVKRMSSDDYESFCQPYFRNDVIFLLMRALCYVIARDRMADPVVLSLFHE